MEGLLVGIKDGWYVGCVKGGTVGVFLEKACFWGILMGFSGWVNGCELGLSDGVSLEIFELTPAG